MLNSRHKRTLASCPRHHFRVGKPRPRGLQHGYGLRHSDAPHANQTDTWAQGLSARVQPSEARQRNPCPPWGSEITKQGHRCPRSRESLWEGGETPRLHLHTPMAPSGQTCTDLYVRMVLKTQRFHEQQKRRKSEYTGLSQFGKTAACRE